MQAPAEATPQPQNNLFKAAWQVEQSIKDKARDYWTSNPPQLWGWENYAIWRQVILHDAGIIGAQYLLESDDYTLQDEISRVQRSSHVMLIEKRILDVLSPSIQQQMQSDTVQSPRKIWQQLDTKYGLSLAEEQLCVVKTWINLQPQGSIVQMMCQ